MVKGITNDIRVPADAECVIEGYLDSRGYVEAEGPYGEFLGYYGGVKQNPLLHCTAITKRRDALFQTASISGRAMSCTDTAMLNALKSESLVWRALETAIREPVAVYATPASGGLFNVRIAMRQRVPGEARNAIHAVFGSLANVKNVFIVDPDNERVQEWTPGATSGVTVAGGHGRGTGGFLVESPFGVGSRSRRAGRAGASCSNALASGAGQGNIGAAAAQLKTSRPFG